MRIAVLGGGHGAYAATADLAEQGHETILWRRDGTALQPVIDSGTIRLTDADGTRDVAVGATADIGEAVRGADLILMPGPAQAQTDIARAMAPHLNDGQAILMPPGSFGTWLVSKILKEAGCTGALMFGESGTLPYLTRKQQDGSIAIITRATRLPTGVFPYAKADAAFPVFEAAYPAIEWLTDGLDGALMNAGPVIHPPLILMNAGPIQHFEHWDIHNEGTQPAIRSVTDALDNERIAVREAFGYGAPHFPLADHYDPARAEWMYGNAAHDRLVVSSKWRENLDLHTHRYMREDVQIGLSFLVSCGRAAGVETPVASGLLAIAGGILGEDLYATGRTLESVGLGGRNVGELRQIMRDGTA
ncbi:NAD/NADP octopine/nopaline dehydrogenase family protein [Minwuia sp.]|uniref:NAD/NADP-dependent octopine/nopaline dehydrogenase family protein n=1 Tax=Minwuia sp. TaxID=2493630 RepID=UPI003A8DD84D